MRPLDFYRFEFTLFLPYRDAEYASSVVGAKLYVSPEVYEKKHNSKRYAFGQLNVYKILICPAL